MYELSPKRTASRESQVARDAQRTKNAATPQRQLLVVCCRDNRKSNAATLMFVLLSSQLDWLWGLLRGGRSFFSSAAPKMH